MNNTDNDTLSLLIEAAKNNTEAFKILLEIQEAEEWEDKDIAISKAYYFLRNQ
jgi:hypothetical protein